MLVKSCNLSKATLQNLVVDWLKAWNAHNLPAVMKLIHDEIVFENWTGEIITSKNALQQSWFPWFLKHGNFNFVIEDIFIDEPEQKVLFQWQLIWPSTETKYKGKQEIRRGVDILHFIEGKICKKYTYSKTTVIIDSNQISLEAS